MRRRCGNYIIIIINLVKPRTMPTSLALTRITAHTKHTVHQRIKNV